MICFSSNILSNGHCNNIQSPNSTPILSGLRFFNLDNIAPNSSIPNLPFGLSRIKQERCLICDINIFTAHKRSLRRLCFYTCLSVILFPGREYLGRYPLPLGRYTPRAGTPPRQVHPPGQDTPFPLGRYTPLRRYTPLGRYTPGGTPPWPQRMLAYGQQAGCMHPTGMHSCVMSFLFCFNILVGNDKRDQLTAN